MQSFDVAPETKFTTALASGRRDISYVAPYASQESMLGKQPWLAVQNSRGLRLLDEADQETDPLGDAFGKKLSMSTRADDDAESYAYEGDDDDEYFEFFNSAGDEAIGYAYKNIDKEEASTVSGEGESTEADPELEAARVIPSVGSAYHSVGECKPCAWFWKPGGCRNGMECRHCHLCSEGQLRARKRGKTGSVQSGAAAGDAALSLGEPLKISTTTGLDESLFLLPPPPGLHMALPTEEHALAPLLDVRPAAQLSQAAPPPGLPSPRGEAEDSLPGQEAEPVLFGETTPSKSLQEVIVTLMSTVEQQGHTMADLQRLLEHQKDIPSLATHSIGSVWHGTGQCRPCMWFWRPQGCENRAECLHCHLCADGASKMRKKLSKSLAKQKKQERRFEEQQKQEGRVAALLELAYEQLQTMLPPQKQLEHLPLMQKLVVPPGLVAPTAADSAPALVAGGSSMLPAVPPVHSLAQPAPASFPSVGSALHGSGQCKPCAWFWKPQGCKNGKACEHCHACVEGALQARKKAKVAGMRVSAPASEGRW